MKKYKIILAFAAALLLAALFSCRNGNDGKQSETQVASYESGMVKITFDYEKISGSASNQFAVWIEDMEGNHIKTLYVTKWTANGGYKSRPDSIALWADKSNLASMQKSEIDAVAGATPKAGNLSYYWDLTDASGKTVSPGEYKFFVEGTLRWKNYVLYSGAITIGGEAAEALAEVEFVYEASDRQDALTAESPENAMIGAVTASFAPGALNNGSEE
jgi:hypothetical protein